MVPFKTTSLTTSQSATIGTTLSAKGIVYASGGNSSLWNSSYNTSTNYQSTSSNFVYQQITSFTPTVGDWYRIITGGGMMGGTVRIGGAYNNQITDVEFQFNMACYGTGGSIQQTRFSSFNGGNISQVRIGGNPSAGDVIYLDINVGGSSGAYAPLYITYTPNLGPLIGNLVTSPVSGATVFSTSAGYYYLLTLAHGFRTTNNVVGNLIQDSAGNSLELKANINSPTFTGTVGGITKSMVGLGNVDNTSDVNKPVSTATQTLIQSTSALLTPLTVTRTLTGQLLLTSIYQNASGNWQSTYTTVRTNSASWEESADILPTVTNYLSTNNVRLSSATISNILSISSVQIRTRPTANIFIGDATTGRDATTGNHNFVFGLGAGNALTTGYNNVFIGRCAGRCNTTGSHNNFLGVYAGFSNTTGCFNNFLGRYAGIVNTTGSTNNFLGNYAGRYNTTGSHNNFLGRSAGRSNTTGSYNNILGVYAGFSNTIGGFNNFLGFRAGCANTTGYFNNFFGNRAGYKNTAGCNNNFFGNRAGYKNTTGGCNNFLGNCAGCSNTTGGSNNFLGNFAGCTNTIGSNNTIIGNAANVATNSLSGVIVLGTGAIATESHQVVLSTANVLFRSTGSTFEIGSPSLTDDLTVYGTISSTRAVFASGGNSNQWNSTYTTVQTNSASWEEFADILPTVTNYLSTSNVLISGLNVTNNLTVDTNTLFVDAANNRVGIGTTSPASPLHIKAPATTHANLIIDNTTSNYWSSLDFYSAGSGKWGIGLNRNTVNSSLDFFDLTNSKAIMTILQNSGNVGIGTIAPNERLTVSGNISATGTVFASAANISGDIVANRIQATVKNFYIKHPTKPDKHLVYSSLESPYNGVQLTGEDEVINGLCVVELPDYLNNLVHSDSVHIQLTNYQHSKSLYIEGINIDQNNFTVKCDSWFSKSQKLKFFWLLNGIRKDIERLETEV